MKLISMIDFIEEIRKTSNVSPFEDEQKEIDTEDLYKIFRYAKFLKQPLTLGMFIPCDEKGNVLEEPEKYMSLQVIGSMNSYATEQECIDCEEYHRAKERVLFEGFEVTPFFSGIKLICEKKTILFSTNKTPFEGMVIEDIVIHKPKLTKSAIKQLRL